MDCARLVDDLRDAQSRGILKKRLQYYAHSKLLIIDELGYLDIDEGGADLLFQLVSTRYEQRSTIITTNVGIGGWAKVFGDEVAASAIADRVCHHCHVIKITGSVSATAKSAERATLSRRRRPRFPAGGATALWPPALPRAAAQGALDRGVVEVRGPDLNLQRRGALGVPGRDRPARDLPSAELREPDRHRDVLCAERGQPPRGVRGPHDCPLSGSPSPSAASASRSFMR